MERVASFSLLILVIIGIIKTKPLDAQNVIGARAVSLGQASTALPNEEWAVFSNPALMSSKNKSVSFFGIRYYGFAELTDMAASVNYPTGWGTLGAGAHRYGYDLFNRSRIRVAYKNSFQLFHYGAVLNYSHVSQGGGYGSAGAVGLDVGIAAVLFKGGWIGARATNINQPNYGNTDEVLPRELAIGLSYQLSDIALLSSDVVKDVRFPISYRGGIEVYIFESFTARAGITTEPVTFSGGFGYESDIWQINVVAQNHTDLGISPGLDLSIKW
ncbi:hypothetical protein NC796_20330 [Aliifodinibius sp. S!AR15-10]|uniref:hypothetical protein n=1 Tax=Aliifodinibius sp. S!AR15-10 TaxID=2950437 RepID=UPI00285F5605|nr:hypothetical protein [Aliifodinibius sp. S!AR15-10]MDR8393514.1 hypothetical protein [Aliifodinibius sp. S!AR15-10]